MNRYINLLWISIIFQITFADPFYKTMPQEVEIVYDELKKIKQKALDSFKEKYSKIPMDQWNKLNFFKNELQIWLTKDISIATDLQEPIIPVSSCKDAWEEYCRQYITYECARQGLDFKKIQIQFPNFNSDEEELTVAMLTCSPVYPKLDEFKGAYFFNFSIDYEHPPILEIDVIKLITQKNYFRRLILKHELVHLTEGHGVIKAIIQLLIEVYYGFEEIKSDTFLHLYNNLCKAHELIADIQPALLSPEFASEYFEDIHPNLLEDAIHPSSKILMLWLKKIELLNLERNINNQTFFERLKKMWYKYVIINLKCVKFYYYS